MKKPAAVVALGLVLAQISLPSTAPACSIAVSIWYRIEDAEVIALVRVERMEVHELVPGADTSILGGPRRRTAAALRVLETWKGDVPATIDVDLGEDFNWSSRKEGDVFVAFLRSGSKRAAQDRESAVFSYEMYASMIEDKPEGFADNSYFPQSLAELDRMRREDDLVFDAFERWMSNRWSVDRSLSLEDYSDDADPEAIRDLVRLAVELQADGSDDDERLDWHVTAAERRATRFQGLRELFYLLDFPILPMEVHVDDSEAQEEELEAAPPQPRLTQDQLRRLAEGFAREPAVDRSDLTMLRLLASYPDLEVDRTAASVIEAGLLRRPIPEWVVEMVDEALKRYGDNFADRIGRDDVDSRGRPIYTGEGENTLPTIWEVSRRDLGIPVVLPAEPPARGSSQ